MITKNASLNLSMRLALGFSFFLVIILAVVLIDQYSASRMQIQMQTITQKNANKTRLINSMLLTVDSIGLHARSAAMLSESDAKRSVEQADLLRKAVAGYTTLEDELKNSLSNAQDSEKEKSLQSEIMLISQIIIPTVMESVQSAIDGDNVGATIGLMTRVAPEEERWRSQLMELRIVQDKLNQSAAQHAEDIQNQSKMISVILLLVSMSGGALVALKITKSVTQPLEHAVIVAERIADGDLTSEIDSTSNDETGRLLRSISTMQRRLREIVGEIGDTAESIHLASSEVAAGNLDLSYRTENASNNLQSVSINLTELTDATSLSASSAQEVNKLAANAASVANKGGVLVQRVVRTMEEISLSSRKISEIIGVIDGIAFQTNILALNAAVEAARAGEQGRGFSVVAGEVRKLAGHATQSAKEIKDLISHNVAHVEHGGELVKEAGLTIENLVDSVDRVSSIMTEITHATGEQSRSIAEVNKVVTRIDEATQQNAALVEEGAAAADSLHEQASRLNQIVKTFRLNRDDLYHKDQEKIASVTQHRKSNFLLENK